MKPASCILSEAGFTSDCMRSRRTCPELVRRRSSRTFTQTVHNHAPENNPPPPRPARHLRQPRPRLRRRRPRHGFLHQHRRPHRQRILHRRHRPRPRNLRQTRKPPHPHHLPRSPASRRPRNHAAFSSHRQRHPHRQRLRLLSRRPPRRIALAVHFGRLRWTDAQIVGEASRREHHPDNASACWMGGLTVARMSAEKVEAAAAQVAETEVACIRPKGKWPLLLAVPAAELSDRRSPPRSARALFARRRRHQRTEFHAPARRLHPRPPRSSLRALEDRIHQPYRAALCPLLPCLQELKGSDGILGAALSGAGPSVLIFLDPRTSLVKSRRLIAAHLSQKQLTAELIPTSITSRGARIL